MGLMTPALVFSPGGRNNKIYEKRQEEAEAVEVGSQLYHTMLLLKDFLWLPIERENSSALTCLHFLRKFLQNTAHLTLAPLSLITSSPVGDPPSQTLAKVLFRNVSS